MWRKRLLWQPLPSLCVLLNNSTLLLWWAWASSTNTPGCNCTILQPLQAVSVQLTAVIFPGLSSKPRVSTPSPHPYQRMRLSGWGTQGGGMTAYAGLSLFCLPQTGFCALLRAFEAPFLPQLISPPVTGLLSVWEPFLFFSSLPGVQVLSCFLFFFFFFPFILPSYLEIFLVHSRVWGLQPVFIRCSLRVVPFVDVFLIYLWVKVSFMSFYSAILIGASCFHFWSIEF